MSVAVSQLSIKIGEIHTTCTLKRSKKRRRTLTVMMCPQEGIIISIPWRTSEQHLQEFISAHQQWILTRITQCQTLPAYTLTTGEELGYLGKSCRLQVMEGARAQCVLQDNQFWVTIKPKLNTEQRRNAVYLQLKQWFCQQAYPFLVQRMAYWEEKLQITYRQLKITNPKRQWGCCHANNTISINWRIMMTSLDLVDYLLVHELCHVVHKNHSAMYWQLVGSVIPDYRERRLRLRQHEANFLRV